MITQELLHSLFDYKDGNLYRKTNIKQFKIGTLAGSHQSNGYYRVTINKKSYGLHRIIFMMFYGYFPIEIDHIDNNPSNNKIENLRPANAILNSYNRRILKSNKTGIKGIRFHQNKYEARCCVNKKRIQIGRFTNLQEAEQAIKNFRSKNHGNFAKHQ
jgi:hypothetical protein